MSPLTAVDYLFEMDGVPNTVMVGVKDDYTPVVRFCNSEKDADRLDSLMEGDFEELSDVMAHETFEQGTDRLLVVEVVIDNEVEFRRYELKESDKDKEPLQIIRRYYRSRHIDVSDMPSVVEAISGGIPLVIVIDCETGDVVSTFDASWE